MTQEELKMELEELAVRFSEGWHEGIKIDASDIMLLNEAAQALAQPEQEPVALPCCGYTDASAVKWNPFNNVVQCHNCGQVYTSQPQRKPLTDKAITKVIDSMPKKMQGFMVDWDLYEFARAIEAAYGIKENT